MAAGLGFKDFTTGEVITAADVDGYLMQGIWVFASAAARDAAVTSPQEGNACYLKDTNQVLTYSGSAWVAVGGGSPLTTKGDLYTFSTVDARLGVGANGTTLVADSAEATGLKWAAPAAGGKVLQVVQATASTNFNTTSTSYVDVTGLSVSITPSSATSKVLILHQGNMLAETSSGGSTASARLLRGATAISTLTTVANISSGNYGIGLNFAYLDEPATTSSTTYKIQAKADSANDGLYYMYNNSMNTILALEIGA